MIADAILRRLEQRGIKVYLEDEKLKWGAPKGRFTMEMKEMVKQYKKDIVQYLSPHRKSTGIGTCTLQKGDCKHILKRMRENSIDCIITDPPYGWKFMGKDWDKAIPEKAVWEECLRILKPGAFAFVMSSPRQDLLSRMTIRLQEAGFEIGYPSLYWTYANGFPKGTNISNKLKKNPGRNEKATLFDGAYASYEPKPAVEVILVAMKPLSEKSYTSQALDNGKGITWLGDCRIPVLDSGDNLGQDRFPANLLVSDNILDAGNTDTRASYSRYFSLDAWVGKNLPFLKVPKASKKEKELGLECFEKKQIRGRDSGQDKRNISYKLRPSKRRNVHPTVKPVELMAYLITMGSREGDVVLDPFCGSGTTCVASMLLKRKAIGIEIDDYYFEIATARVRDCNLKSYD